MWVVIHIAHSREKAEQARALLSGEGFLVRVQPVSQSVSASDQCFELLALSAEAGEAREVLQEAGF